MALLTDIVNNIITKVNAKLNRSGDIMTGDLTVPNLHTDGLVDGRDVSADGAKLDGIELDVTIWLADYKTNLDEIVRVATAQSIQISILKNQHKG